MPWRWLLFGCVLLAGCGKSGSDAPPSQAKSAEFDVPSIAKAMVTALDKDTNGSIDEKEAAACPALAAVFGEYDTDNSKTLSVSEIMARLEQYKAKGASTLPVAVYVSLNDQPAAGVKVTLEPEAFFAGVLPTATATTADDGRANGWLVSSQTLNGLPAGLYKVKVEKTDMPPQPPFGAEVLGAVRGPSEVGIYIKLKP